MQHATRVYRLYCQCACLDDVCLNYFKRIENVKKYRTELNFLKTVGWAVYLFFAYIIFDKIYNKPVSVSDVCCQNILIIFL